MNFRNNDVREANRAHTRPGRVVQPGSMYIPTFLDNCRRLLCWPA